MSFTAKCISAKADYGNGADVSSSLGAAAEQTVTASVSTTSWTEAPFCFNYTQSQFPSGTTWLVSLKYEITENASAAGEYSFDDSKYYAIFYLYPRNGTYAYSNLTQTDANDTDRTERGVGFTYYLLGSLTLEKTVDGGSSFQENGSFRVTLQLGENATKALANWPVQIVNNGTALGTVTTGIEGTIVLEDVKHGDKLEIHGIPLGAV